MEDSCSELENEETERVDIPDVVLESFAVKIGSLCVSSVGLRESGGLVIEGWEAGFSGEAKVGVEDVVAGKVSEGTDPVEKASV